MIDLVEDVVLRQHVVADETAVLALARQRADPLEVEVRGVEPPGVLDVVPDAEDDRAQLVADDLVVVDGVELAAPLDPPVVRALESPERRMRDVGIGVFVMSFAESGATKVDRAAEILRVEEDRRAEELAVGFFGAHDSPNSCDASRPIRYSAPARWPTRPSPVQSRKYGLANVVRVSDPIVHPRTAVTTRSPSTSAASTSRTSVLRNSGDVRLGPDRVEDHLVPDDRIPLGVAVLILDVELADDPALAGEPLDPVSGGAHDPDAHLGRRVAAEHRSIADRAPPACRVAPR